MHATAYSPRPTTVILPPGNDITTTYTRATNFLRVVGRGFWTMDYVAEHMVEFERILDEARTRGRTRTLVDIRLAAVQSPDVAGYVHGVIRDMYRPPDKAAILVASNLALLQMKRGLNPVTHAAFLSFDEAMRWLER
ncbi:hypothetical protein GCM10011380_31100 [Sphingomonas metalli]|uniref:STAS/SEC14 domain-containing protein n=1 Tax=Sphingomonas metalli TaxID=1779358 RepID=A0A916TBX9_9SPHN|nr:hypothetical protein [Sphingomonas metalli]GGB39383.1 hypothetical protein GCM10011380_31100 [Sphingomonas metalli]